MDPQACWQRILDAINAEDRDEYESAFYDLYTWLRAGGCPPVVNTLPTTKMGEQLASLIMPCYAEYMAILSINPQSPIDGFKLVRYDWRGNERESFPLGK